jgi:hypothetical protein
MLKYKFLLIGALLFLLPIILAEKTFAQSNSGSTISPDQGNFKDEQHAPNSIEEEMRAKRAIQFAESEHKETLERARELSLLGGKLAHSFVTKNSLGREDFKLLEKLEKLAKQLRSKAGGSESEKTLKDKPIDLKSAVVRVSETADSLAKLVEKTPRRVVSAAVIDEANVLLQLIDVVRDFSKE